MSEFVQDLEDEAIYILREAAAQFQNPVILFSGGKDSTVLIALSQKAFAPGPNPFPILHIDTGHNFPETIVFGDNLAKQYSLKLLIGDVTATMQHHNIIEHKSTHTSHNSLQSITLLEQIQKHHIDACIGGGRRDEEKARAKDRIFSIRNPQGAWQPEDHRPELFNILISMHHLDQSFRVFPISNWTELDVWNYILKENIALPSLYFSHRRNVFNSDGYWWPENEFIVINEKIETHFVRFRTVGDMTCSAEILSQAASINEIIYEIKNSEASERYARLDAKVSDAAMELRKKQGYF